MGKATASAKTAEQRVNMALGLVRQAKIELAKTDLSGKVSEDHKEAQLRKLLAVEDALGAIEFMAKD